MYCELIRAENRLTLDAIFDFGSSRGSGTITRIIIRLQRDVQQTEFFPVSNTDLSRRTLGAVKSKTRNLKSNSAAFTDGLELRFIDSKFSIIKRAIRRQSIERRSDEE